jgi:peptidoglycan/xylan/chitin deacetylase (PgdA/CDA1 family)
MGYRDVHWNVTTNDWQVSQRGTRLATETAAAIAQLRTDAIVLMHTWPLATGSGMPSLIERLARRDVRFVGVDELIGT